MPELQEAQKLIEIHLPTEDISDEGSSERYQRGKTPHTIFTWWARRPFTAMRAIVKASVTPVPSAYPNSSKKRVLDLFAGGATIPIEIASAGAQAFSLDNNELAHFIQFALLNLSQTNKRIGELVELHGENVLEQLKTETRTYFPARQFEGESTIAYFWSRSITCPSCGGKLSLQKRPWLSKKKNKNIYIQRQPDISQKNYSLGLAFEGKPYEKANAWVRNTIVCPFCSHTVEREEMDNVLSIPSPIKPQIDQIG